MSNNNAVPIVSIDKLPKTRDRLAAYAKGRGIDGGTLEVISVTKRKGVRGLNITNRKLRVVPTVTRHKAYWKQKKGK